MTSTECSIPSKTFTYRSGVATIVMPLTIVILAARHVQGLQRWVLQACGGVICLVAIARIVAWLSTRSKAGRTSCYSAGTSEILLVGLSPGAIVPEVPPDVQFEPHTYEGVPSHTVSWRARSALSVLSFAWSVAIILFVALRFHRPAAPPIDVDVIAVYCLALGCGVLTISVLVDCVFETRYIVLPSMLQIETTLRGFRSGTETACLSLDNTHIELDIARGRLRIDPREAGSVRKSCTLPLPRTSEISEFSESMILAVLAVRGRADTRRHRAASDAEAGAAGE